MDVVTGCVEKSCRGANFDDFQAPLILLVLAAFRNL
jgi:hypothetical protein